MNHSRLLISRRGFLGAAALSQAYFLTPGLFADEVALIRTPRQTEGPFYPVKLPLDTDNDLLIVNDGITPAVGEITHLTGRVLNAKGQPVRNALVEIWQVDNNAAYVHERSDNFKKRDKNFQGFGRFLTGTSGEYYFRTIKPVPYPGTNAAHPLQNQEKRQGVADDAVLRQGACRKCKGLRPQEHPR